MTPVVLIATHQRLTITKANIESLLKQTVKPKIVLGVSDEREAEQYHKWFPQIDVYGATNEPLGFKWQMGVMRAKRYNPDPLIITGSDDILGPEYIENALMYLSIPMIAFLGIRRWYVYNDKCLYLYDYLPEMPLGGGRCYSGELLEDIKYELFDQKRDRLLDDLGWENVKKSRLKRVILQETKQDKLNLVSFKGDWPCMNPFSKFGGHKNVNLLYQSRDLGELKSLVHVTGSIL